MEEKGKGREWERETREKERNYKLIFKFTQSWKW